MAFWDNVKSHFPIRSQPDADGAATLLLGVAQGDADYWRARAWFAYLCATAVLDWWDFGSDSWSDGPQDAWAGLPRQTFWRKASALADDAVTNIDDSNRYDALWAQGFIAVAEGDFQKATRAYERAIEAGGDNKDSSILAEMADAYVYAGDLVNARASITAAFDKFDPQLPPAGKKWFYWVRAWVSIAEGVMKVGQPRRTSGRSAREDIERLQNQDGDEDTFPRDFDAGITKMLALYLENGDAIAPTTTTWNTFKRKVRRKKGITWNRHLELARSPFNIANSNAKALRGLLMQVVPEDDRN